MRAKLACCLALASTLLGCGDDDGAGARTITQLVGPSGGTVELSNGGKVEIPAGALSTSISIKITELKATDVAEMPPSVEARGKPYAFEPHGQVFAAAVKITVPFTGSAPQVHPFKLEDEEDQSWAQAADGNKDNGKLSFDSTSFSVVAPAAPTASLADAADTEAGM